MKTWIVSIAFASALAGNALAATQKAPDPIDLPVCSELVGPSASGTGIRVGIEQPANPALARHIVKLGQSYENVIACKETWRSVLPGIAPWSKVESLERYYGYGAYAFGVVLAILFFNAFTPPHWWNRLTVLGLLALVSGGATMGSGVIQFANAFGWPQRLLYDNVVSIQHGNTEPQWADVADVREFDRLWMTSVASEGVLSPRLAAAPAAAHGDRFVTRQPLNLRASPGVDNERLALLPAELGLAATGERRGDWWKMRTQEGQEGWVSSLWLRQDREQ